MSRHDITMTGPEAGAGPTRRQVAALCWRMHRGKRQVLLITSRDTGRWIVPKGWLVDGKTAAESAMIEAWEEAGVRGRVDAQALGKFLYDKLYPKAPPQACAVTLFALRVDEILRRYPERRQRRRSWFTAAKAARKVAEPDLRALILGFAGLDRAASGKAVSGKALGGDRRADLPAAGQIPAGPAPSETDPAVATMPDPAKDGAVAPMEAPEFAAAADDAPAKA